jgi:hypothetical protein
MLSGGGGEHVIPLIPFRAGLVCVVLLSGFLNGCGFSDSDRLVAKPLSDVLASPVRMTDLTPNSAIVRVETRVDVVCSVIFGKDQRYGSQSTDPDMGGRGHKDHAAPLRALEPDTVYHYRLQGTGPDGTVYVSDDLTFRTPPGEQSSAGRGVNLASSSAGAKVVDSSSQFGGATWRPENAIDGDHTKEHIGRGYLQGIQDLGKRQVLAPEWPLGTRRLVAA